MSASRTLSSDSIHTFPSSSSSSSSSSSTDSDKSSAFSFVEGMHDNCKSASDVLDEKSSTSMSRNCILARVRDLVIKDYPHCVVTFSIHQCNDALPTPQFSDLLQAENIEGHTPLYWAVVNDKQETLSALAECIPDGFSYACISDLRLACMVTNNHALFTKLKLGEGHESLKSVLRCLPDEIHVDEKFQPDVGMENQIVASLRIRMFQKRLRITHGIKLEFIAAGRVWWLHFYLGDKREWMVAFGLSSPSLPVHATTCALRMSAHVKGTKTPPKDKVHTQCNISLVNPDDHSPLNPSSKKAAFARRSWPLGDWVMFNNPDYVDCDGTLHATLDIMTI